MPSNEWHMSIVECIMYAIYCKHMYPSNIFMGGYYIQNETVIIFQNF